MSKMLRSYYRISCSLPLNHYTPNVRRRRRARRLGEGLRSRQAVHDRLPRRLGEGELVPRYVFRPLLHPLRVLLLQSTITTLYTCIVL